MILFFYGDNPIYSLEDVLRPFQKLVDFKAVLVFPQYEYTANQKLSSDLSVRSDDIYLVHIRRSKGVRTKVIFFAI